MLARNPALAARAALEGDLRASILAEIEAVRARAAAATVPSELELARRCGASRQAIRKALERLEMSGLVVRRKVGRRCEIGRVA